MIPEMSGSKKQILFICTHNSARSQMAEGMLNHFFGDRFEALSAGIEKTRVRPEAIRVLDEIGIDISHHSSKTATDFAGRTFDLVVTVCDSAKESCPFFPGAKEYIHKNFPDPSGAEGSEDERLKAFRLVRDEIREWIEKKFVARILQLKY